MSFSLGEVADALWPGERALTTIYTHEKGAGDAYIVDLRHVPDATQLGQYWTLSVPAWAATAIHNGEIDPAHHFYHLFPVGKHGVAYWRNKHHNPGGDLEGDRPPQYDYYTNRFLCVEIDYLLVGRRDDASSEAKRFQAAVIEEALKQSGFPFNVLVDSGSKSVHAYIRLSDSEEAIRQFRRDHLPHAIEILSMALGDFDEAVFKQAGGVRLLRTPGAKRDNGNPQRIIAVDPTQIVADDLLEWGYSQLRPEVVREVTSRVPIKKKDERPYYLGRSFRNVVMTPHNAERGTAVLSAAMEVGRTGSRPPTMHAPPSPGNDTGSFDAPFLWWVMGMALHQSTAGWFFSQNPQDWLDGERLRWPSIEEMRDRLSGDKDYIAKQQALAQEQQANPLVGAVQMVSGGGGNKKEFPPSDYATHFLSMLPVRPIRLSKRYGDHWYVFNKVWEALDDDVVQADMIRAVGHNLMPAQVAGVMSHLKSQCAHRGPFAEPANCTVFKNGTLYFDGADGEDVIFDWMPNHFDPADHCTTMIPHDYIPGAQCPMFMGWLEQMQPNEDLRAILQEWAGYVLWPGNHFQKWLMTYGSGNNGKGTYTHIINAMVGRQNRRAIKMSELAGKFSLGGKTEALVCHQGDIPLTVGKYGYDPGTVTSTIKEWVGGDEMEVQDKNVKSWTTEIRAKLMCSANAFPSWMYDSQSGDGFWRRVLPVPFDVKLQQHQVISDFDKIIVRDEMSGIISWAIEGLRRIRSPKEGPETIGVRRFRRFTQSPVVEELMAKFKEDADSVHAFVRDYIQPTENPVQWYDAKPVMEAYREFCAEESMYCVDRAPRFVEMFNNAVEDLKLPDYCKIRRSPGNVTPQLRRAYQGFQCTYAGFQAPSLDHKSMASNVIQFQPPPPAAAPAPAAPPPPAPTQTPPRHPRDPA